MTAFVTWRKDLNQFEISSEGWVYATASVEAFKRVTAEAIRRRLQRLLSGFSAVKKIETGFYQGNHGGIPYRIYVGRLGNRLDEILIIIDDMPQSISSEEYKETEADMYEDNPHAPGQKRLKEEYY